MTWREFTALAGTFPLRESMWATWRHHRDSQGTNLLDLSGDDLEAAAYKAAMG